MAKKIFVALFIISAVVNITTIAYIAFTNYRSKTDKKIFESSKYADANKRLGSPAADESRVIFIGNSITENWIHLRYSYFIDNKYICRGIGGQISPILLLRFRSDVIELKPKIVVINAGINDITGNVNSYDSAITMSNIKSMAQLAEFNGIKVILTSLLPCTSGDPMDRSISNKIFELNKLIETFAKESNYRYVDYYTSMLDDKGDLKKEYTFDGIHPNESGYKRMESIIDPIIKEILIN